MQKRVVSHTHIYCHSQLALLSTVHLLNFSINTERNMPESGYILFKPYYLDTYFVYYYPLHDWKGTQFIDAYYINSYY